MAVCFALVATRPGSAAVVNRFTTIAQGASITHAGNTLALSPNPAKNPEDDIGALITTNASLQVPGYPAGTTTNWTQDSSTATLNLPPGATILYAELEWAYTSVSSTGLVPTPAAAQAQPINFSGPGGAAIVQPDPATLNDTRDPGDARRVYSTRSAIVTGLIAAGLQNGQYTVGAVPAIIDPADSGTAAGWSLIVVYGNPLIGTLRDVELFVGSSVVGARQNGPVVQLSGFKVPTAGPVAAHISISTLEGDPNKIGDQFRFVGGTAPIPALTAANALSGPNNPVNNFFASQINYGNPPDPGLAAAPSGQLDPTGTFGAFNQPVGSIATARRQGWDVTNVDASAQLKNGDTNAAFQGITAGDAYVITVTGIQIDVFQPVLQITKSSNNSPWVPGQTVPPPSYNLNVKNAGSAPTVGTTTVLDQLPAGITANTAAPPFSAPELGWTCTVNATQLLTCLHAASIPNTVNANTANFTVPILVGAASGSVINYASVGGGGDPFNGGAAPGPGPTCGDPAHCASVRTDVQSRSAALIKSVTLSSDADGNGVPTPGDTLTYQVAFANDGTAPLPTAQITDTIPTTTTIVPGSAAIVSSFRVTTGPPAANAAFNGTSNTNVLAPGSTIGAGGNIIASFRVTINAGFLGVLNNRATATATGLVPPLPSSSADSSTTGLPLGVTIPPNSLPQGPGFTPNTGPPIPGNTVVNVVTPALNVLKSVLLSTDADGNGLPSPGDTLTWTVFYVNTGDAPLPAAQIADTLPAGTTIVAGSAAIASATQTTPAPTANAAFDGSANRNLIANTVTVAPGGVISATFRATINAGFSGTLSNRATGTGSGLPPAGVLSNAIDNTTTAVPTGVVVPPGSVPQGPGGTPNTGGPIARTTDVIVTPPTAFGIKSVQLTTDADGNGVLTPGDTLTWTITYANDASVAIPNAQISDAPLDAKTTLVAGSETIVAATGISPAPAPNTSFDGNVAKGLLLAPVTIAPRGVITISFRVTLNAGATGPVINRATLTGNGLPAAGIPTDAADNGTKGLPPGITVPPGSLPQGPNGQPNNGSPLNAPVFATPATVSAAGIKSVAVTSGPPAPAGSHGAAPGDVLTWTIQYGNTGSAPISNAQITDTLPEHTTFVPGSVAIVSAHGATPAPAANTAYNGAAAKDLLAGPVTLAPGSLIVVSFGVTIDAGFTGAIANRAVLNGGGLPAAGIPTGAADDSTIGLPPGATVPPASIPQGANGQPNSGPPLSSPTKVTATAPNLSPLLVQKSVDREVAASGDRLIYTIVATNPNNVALGLTSIVDSMPGGVAYANGSTRIDGVPVKDPVKAGSTLTWTVPATAAKGQHTVVFAAVIAPGIPIGTILTNTANANANVPGTSTVLASPNSQAQTRVIGGIFNDCVTILGRVFVNKDDSGRFGRDDVGLPNVRIYLESGEYVTTDRYGKYNFACVRPGMHVLRLDTLTLPPGTSPYNVRNYDDPRSVQRLAHGVLDAGLIQNINFAIRGSP